MDFNTYQQEAAKTAIYPPAMALHYLIPGLLIEVLELDAAEFREKPKEAGDVCWFVSQIMRELDLPLMEWHDKPLSFHSGYLIARAATVCDVWVKTIRDHNGELSIWNKAKIGGELFSITRQIAGLARMHDITLSDILEMNLQKLADRAERGVISGSGNER